MTTLHLTLKMTTAQVVETSVTNNSLSKGYNHDKPITELHLGLNHLPLSRFVSMMPDGTVFIAFCFVLRIVDALGGAGCEVAAFALIAKEFPENIGTYMVNISLL